MSSLKRRVPIGSVQPKSDPYAAAAKALMEKSEPLTPAENDFLAAYLQRQYERKKYAIAEDNQRGRLNN